MSDSDARSTEQFHVYVRGYHWKDSAPSQKVEASPSDPIETLWGKVLESIPGGKPEHMNWGFKPEFVINDVMLEEPLGCLADYSVKSADTITIVVFYGNGYYDKDLELHMLN